jgi:hypothetical protein
MGVARAPLSPPPRSQNALHAPSVGAVACSLSSGLLPSSTPPFRQVLARRDVHVVLVPDEALGALELKAFLRRERAAAQRSGTGAEWLWGTGHEIGRALLWAATHSTLPSEATHFSRPHCISLGSWHCSSTCVRVRVRVWDRAGARVRVRVRVRVRAEENALRRNNQLGRRLRKGYGATALRIGCGVGSGLCIGWVMHNPSM